MRWCSGIGLFTALFGAVFAAVQTDMKRLLAYSSIENVGIIFTGIGLAILFRAVGSAALRRARAERRAHPFAQPRASSRACSFSRPAPFCTPPASATSESSEA